MAIWKESINLESVNQRSIGTMAEYIGLKFTEIGDDFLAATLPVDQRTCQPLGILNGGASCALAETVASTAANYCVDQNKYYCVGLDINANHIRPGKTGGTVTGVARPIHLGRSTQVWEIKITSSENKLICISRLTVAVIARK